MVKKIALFLAAILVTIQFIRPEKNISDEQTYDISTKYTVPGEIKEILHVACYDCHSNKTIYPWYANIQPVAWWLDHHVKEGKNELNFSNFAKLRMAVQNHKLEETIELVEEEEMPLASYTYLGLHKEANLTDEQRQLIINWAKTQMDSFKSQYPADSLVLNRKPGASQ